MLTKKREGGALCPCAWLVRAQFSRSYPSYASKPEETLNAIDNTHHFFAHETHPLLTVGTCYVLRDILDTSIDEP